MSEQSILAALKAVIPVLSIMQRMIRDAQREAVKSEYDRLDRLELKRLKADRQAYAALAEHISDVEDRQAICCVTENDKDDYAAKEKIHRIAHIIKSSKYAINLPDEVIMDFARLSFLEMFVASI